MSNTAGLYVEPDPSIIDDYEQRADGKWYVKEQVEDLINQNRLMEADERIDDLNENVGDVNSDEKGSGARYNAGKPPMHYIPLRQQIIVWDEYKVLSVQQMCVLDALAMFEMHQVEACEVVRLLTIEDLIDASYVWHYGAEKYAAFNWTKGMKWSIPLACISRHVQAILGGESTDTESGYTHWGHVVCNILMLEHYANFYQEGDDRPPAEVFSNG